MTPLLIIYLTVGLVFGTWLHDRFPSVPWYMFPVSVCLWPIPLYSYFRARQHTKSLQQALAEVEAELAKEQQ